MHVGLMVLNGVHKGRFIPLTTPTFLIGRGKHCHLRPMREDVGREHCALLLKGERVFIRDMGSTNGTVLNRQTLVQGEMQVADGDTFDVGPLQFKLTLRPTPVPAATPANDSDDIFSMNEIFSGQPGETEPKPDSTIQISEPNLAKVRRKPMPDEAERLSY